jgi:serine/threonine-protein kinase
MAMRASSTTGGAFLGDRVIAHLREVADLPDLTGTKYEFVRRLDRGGMGIVYLVRDAELDREVALKVMSADDAGDTRALAPLAARMVREAQHIARLEHPNIVPVHDVGRLADGRVYYAMKLVRGKRLDEWLRENPARPAALRLFLKVCDAVAFAHAHGVIHRDLKPQNVMVGAFGEALVMDWGLAKALRRDERADDRGDAAADASAPRVMARDDDADAKALHAPRIGAPDSGAAAASTQPALPSTVHGAVIGTPAYMAPEQAHGDVDRIDERADVYSLGAILRFVTRGVAESVPRPLASIVAKAMAAEPAARYATVRALADDIDSFLDGQPVSAHRESLVERAARVLSRHRTIAILVAAYIVMRICVLLLFGR